MKRHAALLSAMNGNLIKGVDWADGCYFTYDKTVSNTNPFQYTSNDPYTTETQELSVRFESEDTEFEIYRPPKKKVDMWLWSYLECDGSVRHSTVFHPDGEAAIKHLSTVIGRLEWSKTPFELDE